MLLPGVSSNFWTLPMTVAGILQNVLVSMVTLHEQNQPNAQGKHNKEYKYLLNRRLSIY